MYLINVKKVLILGSGKTYLNNIFVKNITRLTLCSLALKFSQNYTELCRQLQMAAIFLSAARWICLLSSLRSGTHAVRVTHVYMKRLNSH